MAVGSQVGSPELLNVNRPAASNIATSHPEGSEFLTSTPVFRRGPTCLLVVSSVRHSQNHGRPGNSKADLSQDLFESLSNPSAGASDPEILLIQGWLISGVHLCLKPFFCASGAFGVLFVSMFCCDTLCYHRSPGYRFHHQKRFLNYP